MRKTEERNPLLIVKKEGVFYEKMEKINCGMDDLFDAFGAVRCLRSAGGG